MHEIRGTEPFDFKQEYAIGAYMIELEDSWLARDYARHVNAIFDLIGIARQEDFVWWDVVQLRAFRNMLLDMCDNSKRRRLLIIIPLREIDSQLRLLGEEVI